MDHFPQRKHNRLMGYDYSTPGAYFVTICTHEKRCILCDIHVGALHEAPAVHLTEYGTIVRQVIETLPERYPSLTVEKYVIMPNHVRLLLMITGERALREAPLQETERREGDAKRSLLGKAIGYLKMNSSKRIHMRMPALSIWQRSFHDHVIRNDLDYQMIWEYIDTNPAKWTDDCFYPA